MENNNETLKDSQNRLLKFHNDLLSKRSQISEINRSQRNLIMGDSFNFSLFIASISTAILAIALAVPEINKLIINKSLFNISILIYLISFIIFVLYQKDKIDINADNLVKSEDKSEEAFNKSINIFQKQLKNGINMEKFYEEIKEASTENNLKIQKEEESLSVPNYFLELYLFAQFTVLWIIYFSTLKNISIECLFIVVAIIFWFTHNNRKYFYISIDKYYSGIMNKIFKV